MTTVELKEYTRMAKDLETAIYTQKQLMEQHEVILEEKRPKIPERAKLDVPQRPIQNNYQIEAKGTTDNFTIGCVAAATVFGFFLLSVAPALGILLIIICGSGLIFMLSQNSSAHNNVSRRNQELALKYEKDLAEYDERMKNYQKAKDAYEVNYQNNLAYYHEQVEEYDEKVNSIQERHRSTLLSLEDALANLYNENVVFQKYRNLVAITTINEYLESGRCSELEGPNGAYNLYEMELRQNIVVSQLSSIINNVEQIRNNQFTLYQELVKANSTVNAILHEVQGVRENTRLAAYFAGVTALIEASPKVYVGRTWTF